MYSAKVVFSLGRNFSLISPPCLRKHTDVFVFSQRSVKVKTFSVNVSMEDIFSISIGSNGMKTLDKNVFKKTVVVPCLLLTRSSAILRNKSFKKYFLKIRNMKPLSLENDQIRIFFHPKQVNCWNDFDENIRQSLISENVTEDNFSKVSIEITYDNWSQEDLLRAVLPNDEPPLTSYSVIGHIIHLNIKDHLLDYKNVIGEILLDKISFAKTVVYKKHFIDNVFRNSELEVICGEPNFITTVRENGCQFELNFSKVYWNPRLSTEHLRITEILKEKDVLFDVFAGIGPFAIPAAKKKCLVFANDLNPEAIKWLEHNISLNKRAKGNIITYNKDGKDFILEDVKENIIKTWENEFYGSIHVVMNLPMVAPTFIKYLNKLINYSDVAHLDVEKIKKCLPIIHCYFFVKDKEDTKTIFEEVSGMKLNDIEHYFQFVRKVSLSGGMYRITFSMPFGYIIHENEIDKVEPLPKRICLE